MYKNLFAIIFIFLSTTAHAVTNVWHTSTIKYIYPLADGSFVVTFNTNSSSCSGGVSNKYHYVRTGNNSVNQEGVDKMYSLFLTAATSGRKVTISFDSSSTQCWINRAYIDFSGN